MAAPHSTTLRRRGLLGHLSSIAGDKIGEEGGWPGLGREIVGAGMKRECGGDRFSKWDLALCNTEGAVAVAVFPAQY